MIQTARVRELNEQPTGRGEYVLYWMQASQRTRFNHALEHAIERSNALRLPLVVGFGLMDDYPEANARHYAFMLCGLRDVKANLARRGIGFVVRYGNPPEAMLGLAARAALVVCDRGYLRHQKRWRERMADAAPCAVVEVESDVVVPVDEVSDKAEFAARTIRPKIQRELRKYLKPVAPRKLKRSSLGLKLEQDFDVSDPGAALKRLKVDPSVPSSSRFIGGEEAAQALLVQFVRTRLNGYDKGRNEPAAGQTSTLSPYLHFGQISPLQIALAVASIKSAPKRDRDAYLEELIVRRELSINFVNFQPHYDQYSALPGWAKKTLAEHRRDKRPHLYSLADLESAQTGDVYWNAAQSEMTRTGYMHNYMRMYWGKKILEWSSTPQEAFQRTLQLNNKYFIDGRDPSAYANVAWIFGLHDRPWSERPIFGKVRYMNHKGLERKFDMDAYVRFVAGL